MPRKLLGIAQGQLPSCSTPHVQCMRAHLVMQKNWFLAFTLTLCCVYQRSTHPLEEGMHCAAFTSGALTHLNA